MDRWTDTSVLVLGHAHVYACKRRGIEIWRQTHRDTKTYSMNIYIYINTHTCIHSKVEGGRCSSIQYLSTRVGHSESTRPQAEQPVALQLSERPAKQVGVQRLPAARSGCP